MKRVQRPKGSEPEPDPALLGLFDYQIRGEDMLAHGLNPDDDRDRWIYYRDRLAELKAKKH
jgi:hypothetical protein